MTYLYRNDSNVAIMKSTSHASETERQILQLNDGISCVENNSTKLFDDG